MSDRVECAGCGKLEDSDNLHTHGVKKFCDDCSADWCSECGEVKWSHRFDRAGKDHGYDVTYCTECEFVESSELDVNDAGIDEALGK